MTDLWDRATEREEVFREDALAECERNDPARGKTYLDSARECRVCDDPIPDARRRAVPGVQTCIDCQNDLERAVSPR
ncbi:MAG: TraR/DksA C4-type zinc finger protein [Rhodocyclaceae bacterium]|nr:TraR/DksA C4-type zinc finger protein [Rhodocyclaceae bacterium]